jgi:hypothetical protein
MIVRLELEQLAAVLGGLDDYKFGDPPYVRLPGESLIEQGRYAEVRALIDAYHSPRSRLGRLVEALFWRRPR